MVGTIIGSQGSSIYKNALYIMIQELAFLVTRKEDQNMGKKDTKSEENIHITKWKEIYLKGIQTNYQISKTGVVKNTTNEKCSGTVGNHGYLVINICIDGKVFSKLVHRLVAEAFVPNPDMKPQVNHINGIKTDNRVENLEWVTAKENIHHGFMIGLFPIGADSHLSKYSENQIHHVCRLLEEDYLTDMEIFEITGVSVGMVSGVKCRRYWKHISKDYKIPLPDNTGENHYLNKYSEEQIHRVCKMLQDSKNSYKKINKVTKVPTFVVTDISQGKCWKNISSQYDFLKRERNLKANRVRRWLQEGLDNKTILTKLQAEFDMPDRKKAQRFIIDVKHYKKLLQGSTTIEKPKIIRWIPIGFDSLGNPQMFEGVVE